MALIDKHAGILRNTLSALRIVLAGTAAGLCVLLPHTAGAWPDKLAGHGGPVKSITLSADGGRALSGSFDYAIILWRIEGDEAVIEKRLIGHDAAVNDAAFAGDNRAVSVSDDGSFAIWDLARGEIAKRFEGTGDKVLDVAVSPDGRYAATASWDRKARLYDLDAAREIAVLQGHRGNVNTVGFSPDGRNLFTGSYDGTIRMWDAPSGRFVRQIYSHGWGVNVLRPLPDNAHLVFGGIDGALG
ncbi:WD40 repeat domain-containing protein [Breoghania sp. L-A4]|uniref:WD40 repeat domain-containing protein n=1 Tax=Breoghania sp. L-A4 TaxID=2304600 RepID=UPI000E35C532|nr:WD40 repeat domain-containing protein [Breoghania sp. L-A4]AXS40141.1 WD40 repeat domain-containing protein [Breoghania sp. L-A4]